MYRFAFLYTLVIGLLLSLVLIIAQLVVSFIPALAHLQHPLDICIRAVTALSWMLPALSLWELTNTKRSFTKGAKLRIMDGADAVARQLAIFRRPISTKDIMNSEWVRPSTIFLTQYRQNIIMSALIRDMLRTELTKQAEAQREGIYRTQADYIIRDYLRDEFGLSKEEHAQLMRGHKKPKRHSLALEID